MTVAWVTDGARPVGPTVATRSPLAHSRLGPSPFGVSAREALRLSADPSRGVERFHAAERHDYFGGNGMKWSLVVCFYHFGTRYCTY